MHNWQFLLLALLAIFQPIATFTERNLVNGRQQCSDRPTLLHGTRISYGSKLYPEERQLSYREARAVSRESRQYELRDDSSVFKPTERSIIEIRARQEIRLTPEHQVRFTRVQHQQARDGRKAFRNQVRSEDTARSSRGAIVPRVWSRDSDIRERGYHRDRSTKNLSNFPQIRETLRGADERHSFNNDASRLSTDARREITRTRDTREFQRDNVRVSFNRDRDEITGVESSANRKINRMTNQRLSSRRVSTLEVRERRSLDRLSGGTERRSRVVDLKQSIRTKSQDDIHNGIDEGRRVFSRQGKDERSDLRDRDALRRNYRVRTVNHDAEKKQTLPLERTMKYPESYREERRSASGKLNEKISSSKIVDLITQTGNDNIRMINNRFSRNKAEARQVDLRRTNERESWNFERREAQIADNNRIDSNRRSLFRSFDQRRVNSRQVIEGRIRDNVRDKEMRIRLTLNHLDTSRHQRVGLNSGRHDENTRSEIERTKRFEKRHVDSRLNSDSERRERTTNIRRVQANSDGTSMMKETKVINAEALRVEPRNLNVRTTYELTGTRRNIRRPDIVARRADSVMNNGRSDTAQRIERLSTERVERTQVTEKSDRRLKFTHVHLDRDTIDLTRNGNAWDLISKKEQITTSQSLTMNWQYLFYTLQGIYLSTMLLQVLSRSNTKKTRSQNFWLPAQKLLKMD